MVGKLFDVGLFIGEDATPVQAWLVNPTNRDEASGEIACYDPRSREWAVIDDTSVLEPPRELWRGRTMLGALAFILALHPTWHAVRARL
jgi:hypothetical protein